MQRSVKSWALLAGGALALSALRSGDTRAARSIPAPQGREATSPLEIPAQGWWKITLRVVNAVLEDRVLAVAAGMTFFLLLAFVPSVTAFVSIYGLFADRATITDHITLMAQVLPADALSIVADQVTRIASTDATTMTFASIFALLVAMWSANGGVKAMIEALNVAYNEREKRSFVLLNIISMTMMFAGVAIILMMIAVVAVLPAMLGYLSIETGTPRSSALLIRWPVIFLVMMASLAGLYRFGPSRQAARWRWISPGAIFASCALVLFSMLFSIYASNFANFNETYGSLGAMMALLMWLWLSSVIVLVGAEINSETEMQTSYDSTTGPARPLGERDAHAADTVAD